MPHSIPVSKLMTQRNQWPQIRSETDICTAIKVLRIMTEDKKLEHGHSTPLVLDENYNLLGFVHLTDVLKSVRHFWEQSPACPSDQSQMIKNLVVPFAGSVSPEDGILKALDIMMEHNVSLVPVVRDGKLEGMIRLADIFNTVAALLFDEQDPEERGRLLRDYL